MNQNLLKIEEKKTKVRNGFPHFSERNPALISVCGGSVERHPKRSRAWDLASMSLRCSLAIAWLSLGCRSAVALLSLRCSHKLDLACLSAAAQ